MSPLKSICNRPRCGRLYVKAEPRQRECGPHAAETTAIDNARRNGHPRREVYDDPRWRNETRPVVLERDGYRCVRDLCRLYDPRARQLVVAHKTPILQLLAEGRDPFDPDECETLCLGCSGREDGARGASAR